MILYIFLTLIGLSGMIVEVALGRVDLKVVRMNKIEREVVNG